jgi:hypothetical protein
MDDPALDVRVLPLDVEHGGIRLALPVLTLAGFILGYVLLSSVAAAAGMTETAGCISFIGGIVIALLIAVAGDRLLKRFWPSGKSLTLNNSGLELRDRKKAVSIDMQLDQRINITAWRFNIQRGSARVPKGWIMMGLQLAQDEAQITIYTFMPPKDAPTVPGYNKFTPLLSRTAIEKGDLSIREGAEQRRLLRAEDERWQSGFEVRREDFTTLMDAVIRHVQS